MIKINITQPIKTAHGDVKLVFDKEFKAGDFISIYGESGAGKTTILRIIAGLLRPEKGFIKVGDKVWFDSENGVFLPPQKRKVGFVFQDYALFPNLSVRQNLAFALEKGSDKAKIDELLGLMGLKSLANAYPAKLSGGQCQRVALARAIIKAPDILLLDEPLSALDFKMRSFLQDEILRIVEHFGLTTMLVSHDIGEIYKLAKRVIELDLGRVINDKSPQELFANSNLSAKLQLTASVLDIQNADILVILTLLVGQEIIKITLTQSELAAKFSNLKVNDNILICEKAYNPLIIDINDRLL